MIRNARPAAAVSLPANSGMAWKRHSRETGALTKTRLRLRTILS